MRGTGAALVVPLALVLMAAGCDFDGGEEEGSVAPPGCHPGERVLGAEPEEAGVRRGPRTLLGCLRLRAGERAQVIGYKLSGRPCVDVIEVRSRAGGGCNEALGDAAIEVGGRSLGVGRGEQITGRTTVAATRVRARYVSARGCIEHARAGYVRVRDRVALERTGNRRPFGLYAIELPRGARPLTLEAVERNGVRVHEARLGPERPRAHSSAASEGFVSCGPPYAGVACRVPNDVSCDRIGISVHLSLAARRVTATAAGRRLRLRPLGPPSHGRDARGTFEGFLSPAGLLADGPLRITTEPGTTRWSGEPSVHFPLRIDVRYADGRRASRMFRVRLGAGYG